MSLVFIVSIVNAHSIENRPKLRRACLNKIDSLLELQWNKPSDNCGSFTHFDLYGRDNILSNFQRLGSYNSLVLNTLNLKLSNQKSWEFYLIYHKACNGIDSIFSDTITIDNSPPNNSDLDSVSVDLATQKTVLGWTSNTSSDAKGYIIYYVIGGSNKLLADTNRNSYIDYGIINPTLGGRNPVLGSESYAIAAFDSCNLASKISNPHGTIFTQAALDQCKKTITLSWSPYIGWAASKYEIFVSINNLPYTSVGSVVSNISSFVYNFPNFGDNYCFYIRTFKLGNLLISSSSNKVCISTGSIVANMNSYIARVTVNNEQIELTLVTETAKSLQKINIYKRESANNFSLWKTINNTGGLLFITDPNVLVHSKTYSYYFTTEGPCGLVFDTSQIANSIVLSVVMLSPGDQTLDWNLYDKFIKATQKQEVLLTSNKNNQNSSTWNILNSLNNTTINTTDQTIISINQEQICYCLRAIENDANSFYNRKDTSYSNIECVTADPIIFFPNAIQINGYNTSFIPKGVFLDYTKSSYQIYNRWGELIYQTNDIRTAWYGTYNGTFVESDVFAFRATIVGLNGKTLYYDGTITVLK